MRDLFQNPRQNVPDYMTSRLALDAMEQRPDGGPAWYATPVRWQVYSSRWEEPCDGGCGAVFEAGDIRLSGSYDTAPDLMGQFCLRCAYALSWRMILPGLQSVEEVAHAD